MFMSPGRALIRSVAQVDSAGMVSGVSTGSVNILAHTASNQATAQLTVVGASVTHPPSPQTPNQPAPPAPPPPGPPTSAGSLYSGYSPVSPHWPHIRTAVTDFYYSWNGNERAWAATHYDLAMSGSSRSGRLEIRLCSTIRTCSSRAR